MDINIIFKKSSGKRNNSFKKILKIVQTLLLASQMCINLFFPTVSSSRLKTIRPLGRCRGWHYGELSIVSSPEAVSKGGESEDWDMTVTKPCA